MSNHSATVGVTVDTFDGFTPSMLVSGLKLLGMDFVEITKTVFDEVDIFAEKLGKTKTGFHLPLVPETGWDLSCVAFKNEIDQVITNLNKHKHTLNIQHVICHPPEPKESPVPIETSMPLLFENLAKIDLPVYLENIPTLSPEAFFEFYQHAKSVLGDRISGICYDAPHLFITGNDPEKFFIDKREHIGCIHLSDCEKDRDVHLSFGKGVLPLHNILKTIKNKKFYGFVTLEIQPHSLKDLDAYISSYLTTLYYLNYFKYLRTRIRLFFYKPMIKKFI